MKIKSHLELTSETVHVQEQSVRDLAATRRPGRPQLGPPCCLTVVVLCVNGVEGLHMRGAHKLLQTSGTGSTSVPGLARSARCD